MSDTNLTQLIVNHLTRDELHNADFTDHGNELFVQKDHAGVSVGGVGVDALDTTNITNCITEIPQDIKLELNNGTLTLKAGSKVYVPNGAGVFNAITITNDLTSTFNINGTHLVGLAQGFGNLTLYINAVSGTTEPATLSNGSTWYDTANNVIKRAWAGSWQDSLFSLPVAVVTVSNGAISSIDQVFNGFGYIGSTVFTLPGIKALMPDGKNADGTYKNIFINQTNVLTRSITYASENLDILFTNSGTVVIGSGIQYDIATNTMLSGGGTLQRCAIARISTTTGGQITSFSPKYVLQAVDYNDTKFIANQAMPSDRYLDLSSTTITDGMTLTAPADGYYSLYKAASAAGQMIGLLNAVSGLAVRSYASNTGDTLGVIIPVSKGQTITVRNNAGGNTTYFRFIYANGSK